MSNGNDRGGGRMLGDILRDLLAARGVNLDEVDTRPRCVTGCRTVVERDGGWCAKCAAEEGQRLRRERVADALGSLPDWPWCRFGDPKVEQTRRVAPEAYEAVWGWKIGDPSVVLMGPTGVGKTVLTVAKAHRILSAATGGKLSPEKMVIAAGLRFVHVADIAHARRNHPLGEGDPPFLLMAQRAPLLILDELGREPAGDMSVFELLDHRYRLDLPTFATTNLLRPHLQQRYGEAGARRILEFGRVVEVRRDAK